MFDSSFSFNFPSLHDKIMSLLSREDVLHNSPKIRGSQTQEGGTQKRGTHTKVGIPNEKKRVNKHK